MIWFFLLVLLIILAFGGWGYGTYSNGGYANPIGALGLVLLILLLVLLFTGWRPFVVVQ